MHYYTEVSSTKGKLKEAREQHSLSVREAFSTKNSKELWDSVKEITNLNSGKREMHVLDELNKANELNNFYKRFDINSASNIDACNNLSTSLTCDPIHNRRRIIDDSAVARVFKQLHT